MPAQTTAPTNAALDAFLAQLESQIIVPIITLMALIALVVFIWGVIQYIKDADDAEARKKGQEHILWGLVGLVIIFGSTAIIAIIQAFVNIF